MKAEEKTVGDIPWEFLNGFFLDRLRLSINRFLINKIHSNKSNGSVMVLRNFYSRIKANSPCVEIKNCQ